jgi:AraC-like DNA-binding protein
MTKALNMVEANMVIGFLREKLSRELGMSRVHLYKKLTALTENAIEFIRIMRLKRGPTSSKSQMTVAEVAYEVGFNDPRYFSRYFKKNLEFSPHSM